MSSIKTSCFSLTVVLFIFLSACTPAMDPLEIPGAAESPTSAQPEIYPISTPVISTDERIPDAYPYPAPSNIPYPYPAPGTDPTPTVAGYPAPTVAGYPAPTEAQSQSLPAKPVPVIFSAADGIQLAGTFYPPISVPSPVVVLMHQFGNSQQQWNDVALWLQSGTPPVGADWLSPLPEGISFAVLTFDFRGHGGSDGSMGANIGLLADAQVALAFAKTQPGVDPNRIITIGTSIGSDAAVDSCVSMDGSTVADSQEFQGCLGAMSLSPGSYFGVDYTQIAMALLDEPHSAVIYCVAAEQDIPSPTTCNSIIHERFRSVSYPGTTHGVAFLQPGFDPDTGQLIREFLLDSLKLNQ